MPRSQATLQVVYPTPLAVPAPQRRRLGRLLVERGIITETELVRALEMQLSLNAPLGEILVAEGIATPAQVMSAIAIQHDLYHADLARDRPEPGLSDAVPVEFLLEHRVVPWMRLGRALVVATARPDQFDEVAKVWPGGPAGLLPTVADENSILRAIMQAKEPQLAQAASERVAEEFSCRTWGRRPVVRRPALALAVLALVTLIAFHGALTVAVLSVLAVGTLTMIGTLKIMASVATLTKTVEGPPDPPPFRLNRTYRRPKVSMLVPLFREREIAERLIARLSRITYPKVLLDVVLVLEERDSCTRDTLAKIDLPPWMRVVEVPSHDRLTTKPRAMNYALDFCDGDIIGIWDAEDAPEPNQLDHVVARFSEAPDDVVCLQGVLDFYNTGRNWITRCFTIEYATWWRLVLPGLERLGLVLPLGGTTLFFRRDKLEELGGWDAHNVTEDADLGIRLARMGYRTELIRTVTHEEATSRAWPWIKQRSRWLKGFMVTYLVHMRAPLRLWRDLGPAGFWGVQCLFGATLCQFVLAPILWSFWLIFFGLPHPVQAFLPEAVVGAMLWLLITAEISNLLIGFVAVSGKWHRKLMVWVPSLGLYFVMAAVASYKALFEMLVNPFYWDKTRHGDSDAVHGID
ncbi:MAG: glycosyltransferase [Marinibacterium sp.]|nr:glycosyltransferase [Marinibacterium sp.]